MSPASQLAILNRIWNVNELVGLWEAYEQQRERAGGPMKPVHMVLAVIAVMAGFAMYLRPRYGTFEAFIGILIFAVGVNYLLNGIRRRRHNSK